MDAHLGLQWFGNYSARAGASEIHLKGRACRIWIFGEEKHPNQWHLCEKNIKGEVRELCSEKGMGWLPGADVLRWEMRWDWRLGVFKVKRKDFCVIQWVTGVIIAGSTIEGGMCVGVTRAKTSVARTGERAKRL